MRSFRIIRLLLPLLLTIMLGSAAFGAPGNVWHIPTTGQNGVPSTMRDPAFPAAGQSATFYQGVWKGDGANQTGGWFIYRVSGGSWQSTLLGYHSDVQPGTGSHNQFWKATVSMPATAGNLVEYYFKVTFSNRDTTYLHGNSQIAQGADDPAREASAQSAPTAFNVAYPTPELTVNGVNSNYSKSNFYIDENNDSSFPQIDLRFKPNLPDLVAVEIFTNLNNRERATQDFNNDGIEDGILPPNGNMITAADTGAYFRARTMTSLGGGEYQLILPVEKTGAYRLTGRYKVAGNPNWIWIGDSGIRDHAIVVAPKIAREMVMYELHVANANATAPTFAARGTFEDLHDPAQRVNIEWLQGLGVNWIWFQPIHPQGVEGRQTDPDTGAFFDPGSPYSIRNFWEINPLYTASYNGGLPDPAGHPSNYASAMTAFQNFATAADEGGIQLMLDFPFNHTSPDVVLGAKGVEIFGGSGNPGGWQPGDQMRNRVPQFFSTNGGEGPLAYSAPAQTAAGLANAPDRDDFGKWDDVRDVFFGRYATLVTGYPGADSSRATVRSEGDWFDYSSLGSHAIGVWRYFGEVLPYWIAQSGHRGFNSSPADGEMRDDYDAAGIDGLRKDFGQGLPPQCMEYIINRTHSVKWNFVFMSESLDGQQVTYRSSRHFAVLNENIVFPLQAATTSGGYRGVFSTRSSDYGESLVLLNNTSHDEVPYADPWEALIRFATVSTNAGSPMLMYGQEIGAGQRFRPELPQGSFDFYEFNFGKYIPHFKKWNSMQPQWTAWDANDDGVQFLEPVYSGIGHARQFSPALRSSHHWFLNEHVSEADIPEVFGVAKYTEPLAPVAQQDVVLAFTNLQRNDYNDPTFGVPAALADLLGIRPGRIYNIRNIAAYLGRNKEHSGRRDVWLWDTARTGSQIMSGGVKVLMHPVPGLDATWASAPYEAQFLKLYDVTPPPATGLPSTSKAYVIGDEATFTWTAPSDPDGVISGYRVTIGTTRGGDDVFEGIVDGTSYTVSGNHGQTLFATVVPFNNAGIEGGASASASGTILLDPAGDEDGDGMSNAAEDVAGTSPLDPASILQVASTTRNEAGDVTIIWASVPGKQYRVQWTDDLNDGFAGAPDQTDIISANASPATTTSFTDPNPVGSRKFYRVIVELEP